jgi:hypothetical protein
MPLDTSLFASGKIVQQDRPRVTVRIGKHPDL